MLYLFMNKVDLLSYINRGYYQFSWLDISKMLYEFEMFSSNPAHPEKNLIQERDINYGNNKLGRKKWEFYHPPELRKHTNTLGLDKNKKFQKTFRFAVTEIRKKKKGKTVIKRVFKELIICYTWKLTEW